MNWLGSHELGLLVSLAIIAAGIWLFWVMAVGILDGETTVFDERFLLSLRNPDDLNDPIGPHWIEEMRLLAPWALFPRKLGGLRLHFAARRVTSSPPPAFLVSLSANTFAELCLFAALRRNLRLGQGFPSYGKQFGQKHGSGCGVCPDQF